MSPFPSSGTQCDVREVTRNVLTTVVRSTSCGRSSVVPTPLVVQQVLVQVLWLLAGHCGNTVQTIYQLDLFTSFEDLKINAPGLSRQAFVKMLEQRSQQFGRRGYICGDIFQKAFLECKYCRHEREKLCGIDHFSCPACTPDTVAVSADGNRKLYRFSKTKGVEEQPFFDGVLLANDKAVATFVDCVCEKIKPVNGKGTCGTSTWAAARETSKKTNSKCDEEGLEVAVFGHCILLRDIGLICKRWLNHSQK
ncbi:uncharacterized protein LOC130428662 [Triplophysa dalaica]|uniref:uncharacterized protein LOC130428662 n=1 Tax=Triplophysa dalaica TaxID=1582913 RepID=UPI0024DF9D06|nr:uncharacterized protein LOC130428662 [Triplophysa dalaica]